MSIVGANAARAKKSAGAISASSWTYKPQYDVRQNYSRSTRLTGSCARKGVPPKLAAHSALIDVGEQGQMLLDHAPDQFGDIDLALNFADRYIGLLDLQQLVVSLDFR